MTIHFFAKYQYFLINSVNYLFEKNKLLSGVFSCWLSDRGVQFILWIPLTLKMRTHHFSFHPSPFLLDGVTSKPFYGVHSFGKSPKHFPFNQKNYWIGTLPQNRPQHMRCYNTQGCYCGSICYNQILSNKFLRWALFMIQNMRFGLVWASWAF